MLGKLRKRNTLGDALKHRFDARDDLSLGDAVAELKYLVSSLNTFAIVQPTSKDLSILKEIFAIIDGMDIPEVVGGDNGEA